MMAENIFPIFYIAVLKMWGYWQGIVWESYLLGTEVLTYVPVYEQVFFNKRRIAFIIAVRTSSSGQADLKCTV